MVRLARFVSLITVAYCFGVGASFAQLNPPTRLGEPPSLAPAAADAQTISFTPAPAPAAAADQADSPSPKTLYLFDLNRYLLRHPENKTWQYDVINLVSALQGLVNRQEPQLYIIYVHERLSSFQMNVDEFWLRQLRGPGGFLSSYQLVEIETLEELLEQFRTQFVSIVLWDPDLPATGNVALTAAGVENLLPVRYDKSPGSLYNQIVGGGPELNAQMQLSGKFSGTGYIPDTHEGAPTTKTAKTDAYMWAKLKYLDAGVCSPNHLAYFLDPYDWEPREKGFQYPDLQQCMIVNHDFYVSQKAFFLDLDPWFDETATDSSPNPFHKGIDQYMLSTILQTALEKAPGHDRILRIGGFVPWWIKYSNQYIYGGGRSGLHSPAATAEEFISHISKYCGVIDADSSPIASMANASVFQHAPLKERYSQNPVPPARPLENKNYLLFAIGDFRSSALLYQTIPTLWHDSLRGEMPIAWAISPILSERMPHIFDYLYETRTGND
ncbi:MAG: GxGYxYP domain-containing protein, partial [Candidatus Hinthialibacter sp.]